MKSYTVATIKPWNVEAFHRHTPELPGRWHLVEDPGTLTTDLVARLKPRYVFFPHWSWRVPEEVLEEAECICFHMTDVPYGRGGSPLQNLVVLSDGCGGKVTSTAVPFWYDRHGIEGYLEIVGSELRPGLGRASDHSLNSRLDNCGSTG